MPAAGAAALAGFFGAAPCSAAAAERTHVGDCMSTRATTGGACDRETGGYVENSGTLALARNTLTCLVTSPREGAQLHAAASEQWALGLADGPLAQSRPCP